MAAHPTAVVSPKAKVHGSAQIGPYAVVGAGAVIHEGVSIGPHVVIDGNTTIGAGCVIFPSAVLGSITQDLMYKGEETFIVIGEKTTIREFVTINGATGEGESTVVGSGCLLMAYSHVAHNCRVGNGVIIANGGTLAGCVEIEDKAIIGGLTGIHQFCRVGAYSMVGGCTKITQDVVPYSLVDGHPAQWHGVNIVGLKRNGFSQQKISAIKSAHSMLCKEGVTVKKAVDKINKELPDIPEIQCIISFVEKASRGITKGVKS